MVTQRRLIKRIPSFRDWSFFSIECHPNYELYSRFSSFGERVIVFSPEPFRNTLASRFREATGIYSRVSANPV